MSQGTTKGVPIDVDSAFAANSDALVPSQKAVKTAIDLKQDIVTASNLGVVINGAANATPNDTDLVATVESSVVKKITWTNVKAFLKTYFDGLYNVSWTEAVRDASGVTTAGYKAYNTDKNRWEFYEPFWGWRPLSIDGSSRDWGFETLHDLNISTTNGTFAPNLIGTGTIAAFTTTKETGFTLGTGTTDAVSGYFFFSNVNTITFGLNINS